MNNKDEEQIENARIGYQVAVELWTFQSTLNWSRFNAMLTANSIITAVIGIVLFSQGSFSWLRILLPGVGLIFCIFWFLLMVHGRDFHKYWVSEACALEEKYLSNAVSVVSGMASKNEARRKIQLSRFSVSQDKAIYGVILAFALIYAATFVQTVL